MLEMPEMSFSFSCSSYMYEHHPRMSFFKLFHGLHFSYLEGAQCIIHNTVNFETLQLVACLACKRGAKFYLATLIIRLVFSLAAVVFHCPFANWFHHVCHPGIA